LQENAVREYREIEKSIHEITEMYKETVSVVRLQELMVDSIDGYIDDADANVKCGRRNLSELNSKEQQNRRLIYKVFGALYTIVFVYLVFLN
jgi:t-SNARE complex subunit (syntaxin)